MSYYDRRMLPDQPRRRTPFSLAISALLLLWIGSGFGVAAYFVLSTALARFVIWTAVVPWSGTWVVSAMAGLLACSVLSLPAARRVGVPWQDLRSPLLCGVMLVFCCALATPLFDALRGVADPVSRTSDMAPAPLADFAQDLLPSLSVAGALLGAAAIGLGPICCIVQTRRGRRG